MGNSEGMSTSKGDDLGEETTETVDLVTDKDEDEKKEGKKIATDTSEAVEVDTADDSQQSSSQDKPTTSSQDHLEKSTTEDVVAPRYIDIYEDSTAIYSGSITHKVLQKLNIPVDESLLKHPLPMETNLPQESQTNQIPYRRIKHHKRKRKEDPDKPPPVIPPVSRQERQWRVGQYVSIQDQDQRGTLLVYNNCCSHALCTGEIIATVEPGIFVILVDGEFFRTCKGADLTEVDPAVLEEESRAAGNERSNTKDESEPFLPMQPLSFVKGAFMEYLSYPGETTTQFRNLAANVFPRAEDRNNRDGNASE